MRFDRLLPAALALVLLATIRPSLGEEPDDRTYLLERVDDAAIVQLYVNGFEDLPIEQKRLIWHLSQAAIAGRDIYYDQRYAHSLTMRDVLEAIITHDDEIEPKVIKEILRYTKLFWINSGPYEYVTARKFVLKCSPEEFAQAAHAAKNSGAKFPLKEGESLDDLLKRLEPMFFDLDFEPIVTNKSPGEGKDILTESASNLYVGVTMEDLQGFEERYPLNSRLVKRDGELVEEPYRIGGLYSDRIEAIVVHLEEAIKVAPEPTARALRALVKYYQTGETEDRAAYDIAWVEDKDSNVDTINGFIEVYMDPRGVKGAWESLVFFVNPEKTEAIRKLADEAQWFEDHMPWDPKYRKPNVKGITANAIEVVVESGESGPITPIGINLPNDHKIREEHGSKSVALSNVIEGYDKSTPKAFRQEFAWDEAEAARSEKWSALSSDLLVNMHEVIGHASGRLSDSLKGQPEDVIKEYYSALEEARADLIALYFMADPKLAELGLIDAEDQPELARTAFEGYVRNGGLVQLRRIPEGNQIEGDHMRNRQMISHWMLANTDAVEKRERDGKTYLVLVDPDAFHEGVGRLLAEVQRIKSEGDFDAAKELFETHGIRFDPKLRDEVIARVAELDMPSYTGFVMPKLEPVQDDNGTIQDVKISYPLNLETQMLEYSEYRRR